MAEYIEREVALRVAHIMRPEDKRLGAEMANIPAADVAPVVHGRWVEYPVAHYFKCSECRYTVPYRKAAVMVDGKRAYKYCPNCGAKMDGDA